MVLYEGIFVGERQENEENENVLSVTFPIEHCGLAHSTSPSEELNINNSISNNSSSSLTCSSMLISNSQEAQSEDIDGDCLISYPLAVVDDHSGCKSRVPALKDLCFNYISKNITQFDSISCLPLELVEVMFTMVYKVRSIR